MDVTLVSATPNRLRYLLEQDGESPQSAIITAAQLLADCIAGPLKEMPGIGEDITGLTTLRAQRQMLGVAMDGVDVNLTEDQHAACKITQLQSGCDFGVNADTDAVNPLRCELNVFSGAPQGAAILEVEFQHTLVR